MSKTIFIILIIILILSLITLALGYKYYERKPQPVEGYIINKIKLPANKHTSKNDKGETITEITPEHYVFSLARYDDAGNIIYRTSLQVSLETYNAYEIGDYYKYKLND